MRHASLLFYGFVNWQLLLEGWLMQAERPSIMKYHDNVLLKPIIRTPTSPHKT